MKNRLILVMALLLAGVAFLLNWSYLHKERDRLRAGYAKVEIIVAKRDLPAMTVLTTDDLILKDVFKASVGENAFYNDDLQTLLGKKLLYPVRRGSPLMWSQVDMPRRLRSGLSAVLKRGERAVSLAIAGAPAVGGLVQPDDRVDILGTFSFPSRANPAQVESITLTLMQNVRVLATGVQIAGQNTSGKRTQQVGYSTVTFAVSPREAEVLVFAQQTRGQLYLSLRNPDDRNAENELPSVNFDYIEAELKQLNENRQLQINTTL